MKRRLARWLGRVLGPPLASLLARSWRIDVIDEKWWTEQVQAGEGFVFVLWHEALLPLLWRHRQQGVAIVVSEARDGQYLADYATRIGYRLIRGSSTRGGARALLASVRELQGGTVVAFTPDGPRGPRREMKPGVVAAAQRAGVRILPIHAEADRAWRFRSWDQFMLPKPFARVRIAYGEPFTIEAGDAALAAGVEATAQALSQVARKAAWPDAAAIPIA
ncbi:MAG: lysophospholipid acyltransferase family protein [Gemmatimonadota bacterium]